MLSGNAVWRCGWLDEDWSSSVFSHQQELPPAAPPTAVAGNTTAVALLLALAPVVFFCPPLPVVFLW